MPSMGAVHGWSSIETFGVAVWIMVVAAGHSTQEHAVVGRRRPYVLVACLVLHTT